jgi:hypothetical protein
MHAARALLLSSRARTHAARKCSGFGRPGNLVPWNVQCINTGPDNFLWQKDGQSVVAVVGAPVAATSIPSISKTNNANKKAIASFLRVFLLLVCFLLARASICIILFSPLVVMLSGPRSIRGELLVFHCTFTLSPGGCEIGVPSVAIVMV